MAVSLPHKLRRAVVLATKSEARAFWRRRPVDEHLVFLEAFDGNGALCNPEAIFRALVSDPAFDDLRFVWSLRPGHDGDLILREFSADSRVSFVAPGTTAYARAVTIAKYLVTNSTFPRWFSRRPGQVVLNTWHGTPLKKMGFDIDDQPARVANVLRNFVHADFLLSASPSMTDTMYRQAHRLDGLYDGRVLEVGSPRVDAQFADASALEATREALRAAGIDPGDRQLVLFAPTWKGASFVRPLDDALILLDQVRELQDRLGDGYRVALKAHQVVHESVRGRVGAGILVPNDLPTNSVLAVTDQLVTDYSSIFFDFLTLERPIHFFVPDIGDYEGYRGLYLEPDTWPGPVTTTLPELAFSLRRVPSDEVVERAHAARARFAAGEDGHATARVVDAVFRGTFRDDTVIRLNASPRPRSVLVAGGPPAAWNSAAVDAALRGIDLDEIDLTLVVSDSRRSDFIAWQKSLDRRIRIVVRQGALGGSKLWAFSDRAFGRRPAAQWLDEWDRIFGLSRVDTVASLSTDSFWVALAAAGASRVRHS